MNRLLLLFSLSIVSLHSYGQEDGSKSLHYYIETAKENSPLIADYRNRTEIEQAELERLKAMYTHSRLELNGDYLFVPIVSKDGGRAAFKWNARSATDYYGYDLGESSGSFHAGATWTHPPLGQEFIQSSTRGGKDNALRAEKQIGLGRGNPPKPRRAKDISPRKGDAGRRTHRETEPTRDEYGKGRMPDGNRPSRNILRLRRPDSGELPRHEGKSATPTRSWRAAWRRCRKPRGSRRGPC